jgi:uncharacterized protein (TIGR02266 family)
MGEIVERKGSDRREHPRFAVESVSVDITDGENFLFSYLENISEMGIFVHTHDPMPIGTTVVLAFGSYELRVEGIVVWVNVARDDGASLNPGMGVRFVGLSEPQRELVLELIRTLAYVSRGPIN